MNKLVIFFILLLPFHAISIAREKVEFLSILDTHFISEEFASEANKGMSLAINEMKHKPEGSPTKQYLLFNDDLIIHPSHRINHPQAAAAVGFAKLNKVLDSQISTLGLFEDEIKESPKNVNIVNLLISLDYKQNSWVQVISSIYKAKKIVLLAESMDFIDKHLPGLETELKAAKIEIESYVIPSSNNLAIKNAIMKLKKNEFDLILTINSFNKSFKFINMARRLGINVPVLFLSSLDNDTNKEKWHLIPSPFDTKSELSQNYLNAIDGQFKDSNPLTSSFETKIQPSLASFTGYIITKTAVLITENIKGKVTNHSFTETATSLKEVKIGSTLVQLNKNLINQNDLFKHVLIKEYK